MARAKSINLRLDKDGFPIVEDSIDGRGRKSRRIARMTDAEVDAVLAQVLPAKWAHQVCNLDDVWEEAEGDADANH